MYSLNVLFSLSLSVREHGVSSVRMVYTIIHSMPLHTHRRNSIITVILLII